MHMLRLIKIVHTIIWAVMVAAIWYVLYCGLTKIRTSLLWFSIGLIFFEGFVLLINKGSCPLTSLGKRYTTQTAPNFDIYLPRVVAEYNKIIFGTLFAIGLALVLFAH